MPIKPNALSDTDTTAEQATIRIKQFLMVSLLSMLLFSGMTIAP
jgi:hypothetical protein